LTMTDSPSVVGLVAFTGGLPFLVVAPLGGSLIDRFDRQKLMLVCQALATVLALVVAADVISGRVTLWHLVLAAFLTGSLQALLNPTQQSLVPSLVDRPALTNAIGLMSAGQNLTRVAGPSLAGVIIGAFGVGPTFLVQAAAVAVAFVMVRSIALPRRLADAGSPRGVLDGIRLIAARPDLRGLFLLAALPAVLVFPYVGFLNVFARDVLGIGAEGLGMLMAASGSGAVVGSLMVAGRGRAEGMGRWLLGGTLAYCGVIMAMTFSRTLWLTLPLLFLAGFLGASFMSSNNSVIQHRIADEVRGRVMGAYLLTWGLMPLGALPLGLVAERIGTPLAVFGGGVLCTALVAWLGATNSTLREV
ncbi:MAG: MFS transporter, partial [Chloroflexia bacterium]|nr:MFS transporter [Chloroflexia bacterium]